RPGSTARYRRGPVRRSGGGLRTGRGAPDRAAHRVSAAVREYACIATGAQGGRLSCRAGDGDVEVTPPGHCERGPERRGRRARGRTTLNVVGLLQTKPVDILVHKTVEALTVCPTSKTDLPLPIQGTVKFQVQALAADKTPVPEAPFRWTVGDTSLASFDPTSGT